MDEMDPLVILEDLTQQSSSSFVKDNSTSYIKKGQTDCNERRQMDIDRCCRCAKDPTNLVLVDMKMTMIKSRHWNVASTSSTNEGRPP